MTRAAAWLFGFTVGGVMGTLVGTLVTRLMVGG